MKTQTRIETSIDGHLRPSIGVWITLGQAGQRLPGRPSACTIWRWCRKGIRSRGGDRIKLTHVRLGGRILTTAEAVADFGQRLAEADVAHFDARAAAPLPPRDAAFGPPSGRGGRRTRNRGRAAADPGRNAEIERQLEEEGL
jgi:hypothetical protein